MGDKIEKNEMGAGHVACMGEERGVYRVLMGKLEGKRPMGRPMRRWVDNIRTDLQEVGCGYMDWIELAQDRDRWRTLVVVVVIIQYVCLLSQAFLPGTSLEPAVIPTAQASSFTLHYFPYYV